MAPARSAHRRRRRGRRRAQRPGRATTILVAMSAVAVAVGAVAAVNGGLPAIRPSATVGAALDDRSSVPEAASRGEIRAATAAPSPPSPSAAVTATPKASTATPKSAAPRRAEPVAGLDRTQMDNAAIIVAVGRERDLPRRALLVAVMTGMQESSLRNLANTTIPASLRRPNEGEGDDFDSLGVFQQRPSQGWGSVAELMNPRYAAGAFYQRLVEVDDWEDKSLAGAAQAVQRSEFPDAYAKHADLANKVVDALL
ncbi:hypothetical protein QLQ12_27605 [Actinoplanes sp. NEAU-A12]|uniref:Secreted protein n=1 Tax=Actinoplanes sandaracinus TaxID=3045177 RepID=A0ABT6WRM6_9ACTN|nr:hypothetical protein [Actinoplanes sandaracinus]MDI6102391.1 hypothetical protein [Actinoplanes sandaracinus]